VDAAEPLGAAPISQLMASTPRATAQRASSSQSAAAAKATAKVASAASAAPAAAVSGSEESAPDPIRTLTMARLLAVQGYRKRALSIYDELLARDASDTNLRTEADRLRG
jgi:hypothetical protein